MNASGKGQRRRGASAVVKVVIVAVVQSVSLTAVPNVGLAAPALVNSAPPSLFAGTVAVPGASELTSVSCASATVCVAAGQGTTSGGKKVPGSLPTDAVAVSISPTPLAGPLAGYSGGAAVGPVTSLAQNLSVRNVVCLSATRCDVLGNTRTSSEVIAFDPMTGTVAKPVALPGFDGSAGAMACPTSIRCLVVGSKGDPNSLSVPPGEAMVFHPLDGQPGPHMTMGVDANWISCPTTAVCELTGETPNAAVFARLQPASLQVTGVVASGVSGLYSLSCSSARSCEAVGFAAYANGGHFGALVPVDPVSGVVGPWQRTNDTLGGLFCLPASSAPTTTCEALGDNASGSAAYVMPVMDGILDGAEPVAGSTFLQAVSCPTADLCVRTGTLGQPYVGSGEGAFSVQRVVPNNDNTAASCPGSGTSQDKLVPHDSRFDDITDTRPGGFGGVYAHISFAPDCRDAKSNPATSSWVMLQAGSTKYAGCGGTSYVFVQAGIFYSFPANRPTSAHPFAEVQYPCLRGNGTHEFDQAISSGTFGVEDLGRSTSHANCPGLAAPAGGDGTDKVIDRVETTLNGSCLWVMDLPAEYAGRMYWANLAGEVHTYTAQVPGDYQYPLTFTNAHVYYDGNWVNFTSNGSRRPGNPSAVSAPAQVVVDASTNGGTGCQLRSPIGGANWAVYMWSADEAGQCNPYSG